MVQISNLVGEHPDAVIPGIRLHIARHNDKVIPKHKFNHTK